MLSSVFVLSLKIVSVIQQSTGYNIELYIILPVKYYPMMIKITSGFYTLCNEMSENIQQAFATCKEILPLLNAFNVLIYMYMRCYKSVRF